MSDYYEENGYIVFTAEYLKRRGRCCNNGCRHCPYKPDEIKTSCQTKPGESVTTEQQERKKDDQGIYHY